MKDYLIVEGISEIGGPRSTIKAAAEINLVDPFNWEEMLEVRNTLTHQYDEAKSRDAVFQIAFSFIGHFENLSIQMVQKINP